MTSPSQTRRLPPHSIRGRLVLGSSALMLLGGALVIRQVEQHEDHLAEERTAESRDHLSSQLRAEAAAMAASVDGDLHEALTVGYGSQKLTQWSAAPVEVRDYRDELKAKAAQLGLDATVTTYRIKTDERMNVEARSNEIRPDALQEFFTSDDSRTAWGADTPYLPDMELPLVPHQPVAIMLDADGGSQITAFAAIESYRGDLVGFVRLDTPAPTVASMASQRTSTLIPAMSAAGLTLLMVLFGVTAPLGRDLRRLTERIASLGRREEPSPTGPTLRDLSGVLDQAHQTDKSIRRLLEREETARADLEARLRDAELGLCPSRKSYRDRFAKAADQIQATISVDSNHSVPGTLVDLTLEEAIFALPSGGAVDLAPGFPARIRITSPDDDQVAELVVETLKSASVGKMSLLRLRITNPSNLRSLPRELRHLVDNRRTVRVQPDSRNPVTARLAFGRGREEKNARLLDLSEEGAGLQLREDLWNLSSLGADVELRLVLPDTEQTIKLPARITHARRAGGRVRVGLQFDMKRLAGSPQYRKVRDYLTARQAELRELLPSSGKRTRAERKQA